MNKLIQMLKIGLAIVIGSMGITSQQQQLTYASSQDCSTVIASTVEPRNPELKGWLIETCGNGDQTWISPSGKRCVPDEQGGTTACEEEPPPPTTTYRAYRVN